MSEQWRAIRGWEGFYEVSDLGRVRSMDRVGFCQGRRRLFKGRVLSPLVASGSWGHLSVVLCREGTRTRVFVHRLVLAAFVSECPTGMEGCHNDGDPANNRVDNLRWDTHSANSLDRNRHGTQPKPWTRCKRGHEYTPENSITTGPRHRCRTCDQAWRTERDRKRKERAA